jgi:hypothetical protein
MREFFAIPLRRTKELLVEQLHELKTQNKNVAAKVCIAQKKYFDRS